MSNQTHEDFPHEFFQCHWPEEFTNRRSFNRKAENQTYIEFLNTKFEDGDEDEDGEGTSSDEEDGGEDYGDESWKDDEDAASRDKQNVVGLFMKGITGDEDTPMYRDQVDLVAMFCERASFKNWEREEEEENRKHVALLDERNISVIIADKKGHCRPYLGPLTCQELCERLSRKVSPTSYYH